MSSILKQKKTLAKLRAELEGKEERKCWRCKRFGHLAYNYRNKGEEQKRKLVSQNKFEVLASRIMMQDVRGEVEIRQ